jgi:hypothetical protein
MCTLLPTRHFTGRTLVSFFVALQVCVFVGKDSALCQQHSIVKGTVIDSATGRAVFDANIVVLGTTLGAGSDSSGHYVIRHLTREWHVIKATHIGFRQFYRAVVIPADIDTITLNISLSPASITLEGITTIGESNVHQLNRIVARAFVSREQIQKEGAVLMEDIFYRHAPFALYRGYELYVDDLHWPAELQSTINVYDIKEVFVWDWMSAPIQYRLGPGELEISAPIPSIPSAPGRPIAALRAPTYRHRPFIVLIRTR